MKNIKLLSLLLAVIMLLLCACAPNVTDTSDDVSPDMPSDTSPDTSPDVSPDVSSDDPSDESDMPQPTLADFWADETATAKIETELNEYLKLVDLQKYASSKKLAVIKVDGDNGFEEAFKLFEYFKDRTKDYNWYKINPLVPDAGQSTAEEIYNECGDIICIDTDYFVPDGKENHAATELIMCNEGQLDFHWALPYLAPRFSELCGSEIGDIPTEEQFKTAAITFLKTYFPEYYDDDYIVDVKINKYNSAQVYFYKNLFKFDPDADEYRTRLISELDFAWGEDASIYASYGHNKKETAGIFGFTLANLYTQDDQCVGYKDIITPEEAFDNVLAQNEYSVGDITVYKYFIRYAYTDDASTPCYHFVYAESGSNKLKTLSVSAVR